MNTNNDDYTITITNITIRIIKKDVKNLHVSVLPPSGRVRITAPRSMKDDAIRMAVVSRLDWIKKKQTEFRNQIRQKERQYVSGENHYYLGKSYKLKFVHKDNDPVIYIKGKNQIVLEMNNDSDHNKREKVFLKWYRDRLQEIIKRLLPKCQKRIRVDINKVGIRRMKTRWGSYSEQTRIVWLNLELVKKPEVCTEYVLVHELCHTIERSHNKRFITLMDRYLPKWRQYKDTLNSLPLATENWDY